MPRNITVTFADGSKHVYQNAPDNISPQQVTERAQKDFGKQVQALDGGRAAAPRPAAKPAAAPSFGTNALNSLSAVGGALWRGAMALPDMAADAGDMVNRGIGNALAGGGDILLRAHGFPNAAKAWTDAVAPSPNSRGLRLSDVPDKLGTPRPQAPGVEFAGNMLGGAVIPGPKSAPRPIRAPVAAAVKPATAAGEIVQAGRQAGVRVMTSDVNPPRTFIGKTAQALGERIPIAGTGPVRAAQQQERIAAVKSLLTDFGAVGADDAVNEVAADLAKTRGALVTNLTKAKNGVIQSVQGAVPVPQTVKAIDDQIAKLSGINADAYAPVIAKLNEFKTQLASGKTLDQIEGNRKLLGDLFKDPSLAAIAGDGQKALNAIYGPLRSDMGNFIKANAGTPAFNKWKSANDQLSAIAGELSDGTFKKVLATTETTPENVARMLFSKKPSDVARLYSNLSAEGRTKAQAAVLHQAMGKAGGLEAISPDKFVNQIQALGKTAGVHFQAPDLARLDGLTRVLNATQRAAQASVSPPTGVQAMPYAVGAGFTGLFGLAGGIGAAGATGLIARAYESAPVRNALLKLGRTPKGSPQETVALGRVITAMTAVAERYKNEFAKVANDNITPGLAANPVEQQQTEQQPAPQP